MTGISNCPPSVLEIDIDQIVRERHKRHERIWLRLDVPKIIMPSLKEKNHDADYICWKLVTSGWIFGISTDLMIFIGVSSLHQNSSSGWCVKEE